MVNWTTFHFFLYMWVQTINLFYLLWLLSENIFTITWCQRKNILFWQICGNVFILQSKKKNEIICLMQPKIIDNFQLANTQTDKLTNKCFSFFICWGFGTLKSVDFLGLSLALTKVFTDNELSSAFFLMFGLVLGFSSRRERRRLVGCSTSPAPSTVSSVRSISIFSSRGISVELFLPLLILAFRAWIFRLALAILRCWIRRAYSFSKFWRRSFSSVISATLFFLVCWMFSFPEAPFFTACFK